MTMSEWRPPQAIQQTLGPPDPIRGEERRTNIFQERLALEFTEKIREVFANIAQGKFGKKVLLKLEDTAQEWMNGIK